MKAGPSPVQRQRSSVRGLIFHRAASSTWLRCVTDIGNLIELFAVHPGALVRPDIRTISMICGLQYMITHGFSCDVRTRKKPRKTGLRWADCDVVRGGL